MINIIADWHTQYYLAYTNAIKTNKDINKANKSTQTHHKASTQDEQASMHWIWVNAKCKYLIYVWKIQMVQKSYGQKQVVEITIIQEYCGHRLNTKWLKKQIMEIL